MQRLIDANAILKHKEVCELDDGQSFEYISTDTINNAPTVMTIPDNATIDDVIGKIRAEIDKIYERENHSFDCLNALDELKEFIDKFKAESENP